MTSTGSQSPPPELLKFPESGSGIAIFERADLAYPLVDVSVNISPSNSNNGLIYRLTATAPYKHPNGNDAVQQSGSGPYTIIELTHGGELAHRRLSEIAATVASLVFSLDGIRLVTD